MTKHARSQLAKLTKVLRLWKKEISAKVGE